MQGKKRGCICIGIFVSYLVQMEGLRLCSLLVLDGTCKLSDLLCSHLARIHSDCRTLGGFCCYTYLMDVTYEHVCVLTKASVDISHSLVHGHVYETSAQAVMWEDEQHSL